MRFQQSANSQKPPKSFVVPDGYFREGVNGVLPGTRVGMKRLSVFDVEHSKQEAAREAELGDEYNFSLMVHLVAASLCMSDDVTKPYFRAGDMEVRRVFTPQGVKYLYDIVEQLHAEVNPLYDELDDPGIDRLYKLLKDPAVWKRLGLKGNRVRRLLTYILDYAVGA